jgi:DNA-binding MarR family transcriptional regulator
MGLRRVPDDRSDLVPAGGWLSEEQLRAWIGFMRVRLKLTSEMNRQLQRDSGLSLADYDVLAALSSERDGRISMTALAEKVGWERSRTSHQVRRMSSRALVATRRAVEDGRVTEVYMTEAGWQAVESAAPRHVELVRRLFFEPLSPTAVSVLGNIMLDIDTNFDSSDASLDGPDSSTGGSS